MNLKRMILHAMLPAMMLGVFSLLAAPASAASKKKLKAQPIRVACVGNSITYGTGIEDRARDSYPSQLQRMLYRDSAETGEKRTNEERGESRRQSCNFFAEFD